MYTIVGSEVLPEPLRHMSGAPHQLYVSASGESNLAGLLQRQCVAIVGSRNVTAYGQTVTRRFAHELAAQGVVIISGLALGVDSIAHQAALDAGGLTIAVLPSGVDQVYPRRHAKLAKDIIAAGGALVSEYPHGMPALLHHFVARNRIIAGLANALLVTEAAEKSGALHTATFASDMGVDVLAVPGNITSPTSAGTNNLIKTCAMAATETNDILQALGMPARQSERAGRLRGSNLNEQALLDLIEQGISDGNQLLAHSGLEVSNFNHHLTMLEITAKVRPLGANHWALA